ncbi:MAG: hypothetical protein HKN25_13880 [Pyrinomonadaceae bacterium]|nr:hypothetical protein [Pyrinomonadaceae bacterium]
MGAIINTKTGVVYFPEELGGISFGMDVPEYPLQYQSNSRLFILHATLGGEEKAGVSYLVWQGTKFKKVKFVPARN